MTQHRYELLSQGGRLLFCKQRCLALDERLARLDVIPDHLGKQRKHSQDLRLAHFGRLGRYRAQRAEEAVVRQDDRDGDITLQSVSLWRVMIAILRVAIDFVDKNRVPMRADFVADRGFDLQLASRFEPEIYFVAHTACDPAIFRDAGHRGITHSRRLTDHFQDRRDDIDRVYHADVVGEFSVHETLLD